MTEVGAASASPAATRRTATARNNTAAMHTARERSTADDVRAFEIADAIECESALMVNLSVASPLRTVSLWSKSLRM